MNIHITAEGHDFGISVPDRLIFNKFLLRAALKGSIPEIPRGADKRLLAELKRIRRLRGSWVLVEVQSADGEQVTVTV